MPLNFNGSLRYALIRLLPGSVWVVEGLYKARSKGEATFALM